MQAARRKSKNKTSLYNGGLIFLLSAFILLAVKRVDAGVEEDVKLLRESNEQIWGIFLNSGVVIKMAKTRRDGSFYRASNLTGVQVYSRDNINTRNDSTEENKKRAQALRSVLDLLDDVMFYLGDDTGRDEMLLMSEFLVSEGSLPYA